MPAKVNERHALESYDAILDSYAQTLTLSRDSFEMRHAEGALLVLLEKKAERDPAISPRVLVALAGIVGKISAAETAYYDHPIRENEEAYRATMRRVKHEAIIAAAGWVVPSPTAKPARPHEGGSLLRRLRSLIPGLGAPDSSSAAPQTPRDMSPIPDRRQAAMLLLEKLDKYFPERQPASASV